MKRVRFAPIWQLKGKIAALLGPDEPAECQKEIDAQGRLVLPGLIDAHMHTGSISRDFATYLLSAKYLRRICGCHKPIWILPILERLKCSSGAR
ncbi:amidohydrolase family protein [Providencia rettgeri]|uniref:Amidohydrolase family protein n=1 Tax=Providencia rettgeri TaxID=587 RepID=A0A939NAM5_PRORE|nr:amidohydrolase family protein [Providencia rettgeri]